MMATFEKQAKRGLRDRLFLMVVVTSVLMGVGAWGAPVLEPRQAMRELVIEISKTAKTAQAGFLVIPQNGVELVTTRPDDPQAPFVAPYLAAIDAVGQEDLFYGATRDDRSSPPRETAHLLGYLDRLRAAAKPVLVTDYCSTPAHAADAHAQNAAHRFLSFPAPSRELDRIPADLVTSDAAPPSLSASAPATPAQLLARARTFLYLINPERFPRRADLLNALAATTADLLIIDPYDADGAPLSPADIARLRRKPDGSPRLVLAYFSIGEAETCRSYWNPDWERSPPPWLDTPNPDWPDNYKVRYWHPDWQRILFRAPDSPLAHILRTGFDGAYLDIIDAFEHFEN